MRKGGRFDFYAVFVHNISLVNRRLTSGTVEFAVDSGKEIVEISSSSHISKGRAFATAWIIMKSRRWGSSLFFNSRIIDGVSDQSIGIQWATADGTTNRSNRWTTPLCAANSFTFHVI